MFLKNSLLILFVFILSCQPVELLKPVNIDVNEFKNFSINTKEILVNTDHNPIFSDENIEDEINQTPKDIITEWHNKNINKFGNENKFIINILDASIYKKEIENIDAKKYEEKYIFKYDVFFLVEYELYDSSDFLIANVTVESSRSTTSQKYISLNETEIIVNDLLRNALIDYIDEANLQLINYMGEYINF